MKLNINIPESLNEIKLSQYQKWLKIADGKELDVFLKQKMIEIFCEIPLLKVIKIKAMDVENIVDEINKVFNVDEKKIKLIQTFQLNNKEFGFIPNLDDITLGEYVDLDNYLADWSLMHKGMSVLFRPIILKKKKQYLIEDYESSDKYNLKDMTLDIVFGSLVFFYNLRNELLKHILNYIATQQDVSLPPELMDSLKNGAGIVPYLGWQKEIF